MMYWASEPYSQQTFLILGDGPDPRAVIGIWRNGTTRKQGKHTFCRNSKY